jgi:hypothetical protein
MSSWGLSIHRPEDLETCATLLEESPLQMVGSSMVSPPPTKPASDPEPTCDYTATPLPLALQKEHAKQLEPSLPSTIS